MKTRTLNIQIVCLFLLVAGLSCSDDAPTAEEAFMVKLKGEWTIQSVTVGGMDVTRLFSDVKISIQEKNFSVTGSVPPFWPGGGSFTLENKHDELFDVMRSDGFLMESVTLSANKFSFIMNYTPPEGRVNGVGGRYHPMPFAYFHKFAEVFCILEDLAASKIFINVPGYSRAF